MYVILNQRNTDNFIRVILCFKNINISRLSGMNKSYHLLLHLSGYVINDVTAPA